MQVADSKKPAVLCYGDSLTAGMHSNGGEFHPYSRKLQRLLGHGAVCADCGEPGACADALARSLPSRLEKSDSRLRRRWTHVAILAGTNDLRFGAPAEAVISSLATAHAAAAHSGATAIALTLPQIRGEEKSSLGKRRAIVNGWLRDKATASGDVRCADVAAALEDATLMDDAVHFTPKGYDIIAEVVRAAMKQGDSGARRRPDVDSKSGPAETDKDAGAGQKQSDVAAEPPS